MSIILDDISYTWRGNDAPTLSVPHVDIASGEHVFLHGPSGSGKSTLLGLIAGITTPQSGTITVLGTALHTLSTSQRDLFRANHIGFIFQQFNLIPYLSVIDNVLLPCHFSTIRRQRALESGQSLQKAATDLLSQLNITKNYWQEDITKLSIGQQQRVAAARALIGAPDIIIADEPTSALDEKNQEQFLSTLQSACRASTTTLLFISHDLRLASRFDRQVALTDINLINTAYE